MVKLPQSYPQGKRSTHPDILTARKWNRWMWISPLFTAPTLLYLSESLDDLPGDQGYLLAVFGSAAWHLLLLIPAFHRKSEYLRWYARQALLLAGARTMVALFIFVDNGSGFFLFSLMLILVYLGGNIILHNRIVRGDYALMRVVGKEAALPLAPRPAAASAEPLKARSSQPGTNAGMEAMPKVDMAAARVACKACGKTAPSTDLFCPSCGAGLPQWFRPVFRNLLASGAIPPEVARKTLQFTGHSKEASGEMLVGIFRFSPEREQRQAALAALKGMGMVEEL